MRTNVVSWSDELYRIYGFEPQSRPITFEFFLSRLHPDDRDRIQGEVGTAMERGTRFAYPERIVRPDGSIRHLDTIGEATRDGEGRVVGLIGTCRDVTEDYERNETIRLYADIVRNMQLGVAVFEVGDPSDPETFRLVAFNPEAERAARRPLDGQIGKPLFETLPYSKDGPLPGLLSAVARDGQVREVVQERAHNPAHPERAVSMKAFPLPGGRIGLAVDDITTQTRIQRVQAAAYRVLERIVAGDSLPEVLTALVTAIEENLPSAVGTIELVDGAGHRTLTATSPGSAGLVGPRTSSSTPILATDGRTLGTLTVTLPGTNELTADQKSLLVRAAYLSGLAVERSQMEVQLRELTAHLESAREDERAGIAREIHDELGQALTALKMDVAWLGRRLAAQPNVPDATLLVKIYAMAETTDGIIEQVRRISSELRPGVLDDLGLQAAIEWQGQEFERRTGAGCTIVSNLADEALDRGLATGAFRIFQEALTNVARHARATLVQVVLERRGDKLVLEVRDDGRGIAPEVLHDPKSLGLLGIRERARRLGGAAHIHAGESGGTVVSVEVPIERRAS